MIAKRALMLLLLRHGHAWVPPSLRRAPAVGRRAAATVSETAAASTPPAPGAALAWDNDAWKAGYTTARAELSECIEAPSLPADLRGTYYRNGPGQFEVGSDRVLHPFDADGMVTAATFSGNGTCFFRNRFVRTQGFQKERRAGKALYPGQFGNAKPFWAGGLTPKNVANTNVVFWAGRLVALWEGGQPHKLDPLSLGTAGATDLSACVPPGKSLAAHPRLDAATGKLVAFSYKPNPLTGTALRILEFDPGFKLARPILEHTVPGVFGLFHDFVVTKNYVAFTASPQSLGDLKASAFDLLLGRKAPGQALEFDATQPSTFLVFRRDGGNGGQPHQINVDTHFNFHYANAFEDDAGHLVVDSVRADRLELGSSVGPGGAPQPVWETVDFARDVPLATLWRYTLDVAGAAQAAPPQQLSPRHLDFPTVNAPRVSGLPHRFVWACCGADARPGRSSPPQGIVKVDTSGAEPDQVWLPEPWQFCGEPCFARRAVGDGPAAAAEAAARAEDDGYVLTLVSDGRRGTAELVVLDAARVANGPVARVPVDGTNLPHGLHGCWAEDARFSDDALAKAHTLLKLYARKSMEWNQVDAGFSGLGIVQFFGQKGLDGR